jgi:hypothetical protein
VKISRDKLHLVNSNSFPIQKLAFRGFHFPGSVYWPLHYTQHTHRLPLGQVSRNQKLCILYNLEGIALAEVQSPNIQFHIGQGWAFEKRIFKRRQSNMLVKYQHICNFTLN